MKRIYTSNDPTILRIHPKLAEQIGLNESIMLLQIEFLISISSTDKKQGKDWTYQSVRKLQKEYFPFWSTATINRIIHSLQENGYIRIDNFNKHGYDRTRWMSINYKKVSELDCITVADMAVSKCNTPCQNDTSFTQNDTTIPEITTENPTDIYLNDDLFSQCQKIYETKKGRLLSDIQGFVQMINNFKASGVTAKDYAAAIDAMDADPKYKGSRPTSYERWAIGYAEKRNNPIKQNSIKQDRKTYTGPDGEEIII